VQHDLGAVRRDTRGVRAEDHRELLLAQADAAQGPQVVMVERGGAHLDRGPVLALDRRGAVGDLQSVQRGVGGEAGDGGSEHDPNVEDVPVPRATMLEAMADPVVHRPAEPDPTDPESAALEARVEQAQQDATLLADYLARRERAAAGLR